MNTSKACSLPFMSLSVSGTEAHARVIRAEIGAPCAEQWGGTGRGDREEWWS